MTESAPKKSKTVQTATGPGTASATRRTLAGAFRLPALLALAFLITYFVVVPVVLRVRGDHKQRGVAFVTADGGQDYIRFEPQHAAFMLDVASTPASLERGLSGRPGLDQSHGMLFIFDHADKTCFWMKDMKFDIDILWFDEGLKLVHAQQAASPASYPETFCPPINSKYVIEVTAGTVDRLHLKIGDTFSQP